MKQKKLICIALLTLMTGYVEAAEIPINIGLGPAYYLIPEKIQEESTYHSGLSLHIKAVIDKTSIEKNKNKIPQKYHDAVSKVDEVKVGFILIPDSIIISPRKRQHGLEMYGASWRPLAINVPIKAGPAKLSFGTGMVFSYLFVNLGDYKIIDAEEKSSASNNNAQTYLNQVTHFIRPGIDLRLDLEIKFSPFFLTSIAWTSAYYIPQKIGGSVFELSNTKSQNLWRIHHGSLLFNVRFPYQVAL